MKLNTLERQVLGNFRFKRWLVSRRTREKEREDSKWLEFLLMMCLSLRVMRRCCQEQGFLERVVRLCCLLSWYVMCEYFAEKATRLPCIVIFATNGIWWFSVVTVAEVAWWCVGRVAIAIWRDQIFANGLYYDFPISFHWSTQGFYLRVGFGFLSLLCRKGKTYIALQSKWKWSEKNYHFVICKIMAVW